jgi:hypothetical protein
MVIKPRLSRRRLENLRPLASPQVRHQNAAKSYQTDIGFSLAPSDGERDGVRGFRLDPAQSVNPSATSPRNSIYIYATANLQSIR